jgi:hypothetical protein
MIQPTNVSICRTQSEWQLTACSLRIGQPELAAKITLARLAHPLKDVDTVLTITFTTAEHERLVRHVPAIPGQTPRDRDDQIVLETAQTIADISAFLHWPPLM